MSSSSESHGTHDTNHPAKAWECPQCRCTTYARVEERKPGETKFTPGDSVRCVNCKFVSYLPALSHTAGEIEAGGEDANTPFNVFVTNALHEQETDALKRRIAELTEQAFRDGVAYATNCEVTDVDLAWSQSRVRAALEPRQ